MTKRTHDSLVVKTRLKELRNEMGITQKEVAERINFSVSTIKQYENGYRIPDEENLTILASFYDVFPRYILGEINYRNDAEKFSIWLNHYDSNHKNEVTELSYLVKFIELAEELGLYIPSDPDDFEKSYTDFLEYIKLYPEYIKEKKGR